LRLKFLSRLPTETGALIERAIVGIAEKAKALGSAYS
jgi:hypothetical protein